MAFSNALNGRKEDLRFPNLRSPEAEVPFSAGLTSPRDSNPFFTSMQSTGMQPANVQPPNMQPTNGDVRGTLQRRFTTDSSKLSIQRPFGQHYSSFGSSAFTQKQLYEDIQDARRKAQEQLALLDMQERNLQMTAVGAQDIDRLSKGLNRVSINGPVSEPTTPPDYSEDVFSNRFSRSSRMSSSAVTSPPGLPKRTSQSSSKITSPPSNRLSNHALYSAHRQSTKSMPGSRRGSDEDEYYPEDLPAVRSAATFNRFSMPVNGSRHRASMSTAQAQHNGPAFDTSFLLEGDEDGSHLPSPIAQAYAQLGGDDTFPTLTSDGLKLSANPAALDLASSKTLESEWTLGSRPRAGHASMPHTDSSMYRPVLSNLNSPPTERPAQLARRKSQRHSLGVTFDDNTSIPPLPTTRPASLQTSYSTNDVPTVKNALVNMDALVTPPKTQAEQHFHAHNVSLGRIPPGAVNRQSREMQPGSVNYRSDDSSVASPQLTLQASAAPFGPAFSAAPDVSLMTATTQPNGTYASQPATYPFSMQTYSTTGSFGFANSNAAMINMVNGYNAVSRPQDSQVRATASRRQHDETRFNNVPLESYRGNLYELCKDQHGCRYLQRKLEDGHPDHIEMIFQETCPHIVELMTDPFGNYLCQKLFEHCIEDQRTALINTAAPALTVIALNQHGTRALQKMIEYVHTDVQIDTIIQALSPRVVELVQDLNGNHVIQKCLTRLGAERCQFIYDAVGNYCVVVGTHRHGCCVLQRCIDHSQGNQRAQLIERITNCAFDLVQDPFGNYVVQYILDLDETSFTTPLCKSFAGRVVPLSRQKFSSNVIEKCLRTAAPEMKKALIDEMLIGNELESMLRDSFANYVIQTAMDYSDSATKMRIVDMVRPILPTIKQTPHGRRIASKITSSPEYQGRVSGTSSGAMTPTENFASGYPNGRGNRRQVQIVGGGFNKPGYTSTAYAPPAETQNGQYQAPDTINHAPYYATTNINGNYTAQNAFAGVDYPLNPAQNGFGNGFQNGHAEGNYI